MSSYSVEEIENSEQSSEMTSFRLSGKLLPHEHELTAHMLIHRSLINLDGYRYSCLAAHRFVFVFYFASYDL